ncbi:hypothetical protein F0562_032498 [Nyssa sinensis]|uniref:Vacuolar iron transporter n=1 Tax=Nyssa sinensis TaxID=561372 RepID=A0A5J5AMW8_9ASTE|nr:hypothetical protein F0562_032498 [Nyssa sinensis]
MRSYVLSHGVRQAVEDLDQRLKEKIVQVKEEVGLEFADVFQSLGLHMEPPSFSDVKGKVEEFNEGEKPVAEQEVFLNWDWRSQIQGGSYRVQSALTIAIAYILGGLVPLIPYMFIPKARNAVIASIILTLLALLIFGYGKSYFTGNKPFRSALQAALIGSIASAAAFGMARAVQG